MMRHLVLAALAAPVLLVAGPASAQTVLEASPGSIGDDRMGSRTAQAAGNPDFLFRTPRFSLTARGGFLQYRARGELFDFTTDRFTADRSDFRGGGLGLELGIWAGDRWEVMLGFDGGQATVHSQDREWDEELPDGSFVPITQTTRLRIGPVAQVGLKGYVLPRGESISQFAWAPAPIAPFIGAGAGYSGYSFRQWGDFVDEVREEIFEESFVSEGGSFITFATVGADVNLRRNLAFTAEARYQWGEDRLDGDFSAFEPLDLSGLRLTAGLSVRF